MRRSLCLALIVGGTAVVMLFPPAVGAQEEVDGREVFLASCAACHQGTGVGVSGSFPPLVGNDRVQDTEYVKTVLAEGKSGPLDVLGVSYDGEMPSFPDLSGPEIDAVIGYIQAGVFIPAETGGLEPGDAARGKDLFTGGERLENGAPACASCHTAAGFQALNGPALGPDLTDLSNRYGGEEAVAAALVSPPSATMQPLFSDSPIADQERSDLAAYFASLSNVQPSGGPDVLVLGGALGVVALFALMLLAPRSRRPGFARQLRSQR
ncbi:MAG: c-type cytochrome [Acidimicrobiia bacterium]|nr:c-type cytochrome [Acidimicrobiia bacterium]